MPPKKVCNLKSNDNPSVVFSQQLTSRTLYIRHFKSNSNSWIWRTFCCSAFYQTPLKSCILRTRNCHSLQALKDRTLKKPKRTLHNRISQTLNRLILRTLNLKTLLTRSSRNLRTLYSRILLAFHGCSLRTFNGRISWNLVAFFRTFNRRILQTFKGVFLRTFHSCILRKFNGCILQTFWSHFTKI